MREADVAVRQDALEGTGVGELLSLTQAAGLRDMEALTCGGSGAVVAVEVEERLPADRLEDLEVVDEWREAGSTGDAHAYIVEFSAESFPPKLAGAVDDLVGTCDPELAGEDVSMSLSGPQSAIADAVAAYESTGAPTELRSLSDYDGGSDPLDELTDRQREVLETAFELGYFDVPRAASTDDVAAALDIDDSTVAEHLQRAEHNLLAELL